MSNPKLRLYHFPGACSQVSRCALDIAGLDYELAIVNLAKGEQASADYARIAPLAKVPTLVIDGEPLSENAAILVYVAALRPETGVLPLAATPRQVAEIQSGLTFCGATLHPQVRGLANPARFTTGDIAPVHERSMELAQKSFAFADRRIEEKEWWLGEFSIIDVYLNWTFMVASHGGFPREQCPNLVGLAQRLMQRPIVAHAIGWDFERRAELGL